MTIDEAKRAILQDIRDGCLEMEAGYPQPTLLNRHQRDLIFAYDQQYGECWLGRTNLHGEERSQPVIWKWDGSTVLNFGADFVVPRYDPELERLVLERDAAPYEGTRRDSKRVSDIHARIYELGGDVLIWN